MAEFKNKKYPVCPECGQNSIVLFSPPKENPVGAVGSDEYVDWDKAHLYCANGTTNCKFDTRIKELTTPLPAK